MDDEIKRAIESIPQEVLDYTAILAHFTLICGVHRYTLQADELLAQALNAGLITRDGDKFYVGKKDSALDAIVAFQNALNKAVREADPECHLPIYSAAGDTEYLLNQGQLRIKICGTYEPVTSLGPYYLKEVFTQAPRIYKDAVAGARARREARERERRELEEAAEELCAWMKEEGL